MSKCMQETIKHIFNHVSLLGVDGSQDHAIIDLLAGLEDDGFCKNPISQNAQSQSFLGAGSYHCNSDEEEAGPEREKEEAELSFLMSQQWDNDPPENFSSTRQAISAFYRDGWIRCIHSVKRNV